MIGAQEILIIGGALVLIFGARKIPELARSLGRSMTEFKKGLSEGTESPDSGDKSSEDNKAPDPKDKKTE